ncbi:TIGR03943 family putative permease subunit [Bacillus weihaiensis]|uniref:TIGR03943 family putative permease subunit n=1 Tax=Bacillus weihaiensis TaxID=1547283 RepID=UPI002355A363|nr:TIGR03943 family protein [Bacillus weihaiensis]
MEQSNDLSFQKYIRGIILVGFTLLLVKLIISGDITNFIAPKMLPFVYFATGTFLILGILQIWRSDSKQDLDIYCDCGLDHSGKKSPIKSILVYSLFLFPVLTGFMFPEVVLDSSVIAKRGINLGAADTQFQASGQDTAVTASADGKSDGASTASPTNEPKTLDELYLEGLLKKDKIEITNAEYTKIIDYIERNLDQFIGKEVQLTGFVYREPEFEANQMAISRFTVSCCVADLQVIGTMATGEEATQLKNDEWVTVTGTIEKGESNGKEIPSVTISSLEKIEAPEDPYIYIY